MILQHFTNSVNNAIGKCDTFKDFCYSCTRFLDSQTLTCPKCGKTGCLVWKGYFERGADVEGMDFNGVKLHGVTTIKVRRCLCKECRVSSGVLPSILVPYSQATLENSLNVVAKALELVDALDSTEADQDSEKNSTQTGAGIKLPKLEKRSLLEKLKSLKGKQGKHVWDESAHASTAYVESSWVRRNVLRFAEEWHDWLLSKGLRIRDIISAGRDAIVSLSRICVAREYTVQGVAGMHMQLMQTRLIKVGPWKKRCPMPILGVDAPFVRAVKCP